MPAREPRIGVVVLYYRFGMGVSETISRVMAQVPPPSRIVLLDNASGDGVCDSVARETGVELIRADENRGYGAGMNLGMSALPASEYVLLLSHDCLLEPGCIAALLAQLES